MNHSSNESLSKLEFKNDFISDFAKNKLVEVVRVTNALAVEIIKMTSLADDGFTDFWTLHKSLQRIAKYSSLVTFLKIFSLRNLP